MRYNIIILPFVVSTLVCGFGVGFHKLTRPTNVQASISPTILQRYSTITDQPNVDFVKLSLQGNSPSNSLLLSQAVPGLTNSVLVYTDSSQGSSSISSVIGISSTATITSTPTKPSSVSLSSSSSARVLPSSSSQISSSSPRTQSTNLSQSSSPTFQASSNNTVATEFSPQQEPVTKLSITQSPKVVNQTADTQSQTVNQPGSSLSIPKLGIYNRGYSRSSLFDINDLYKKLVNYPVLENQSAGEVCQVNTHSYIYGHSEPSSYNEIGNATSIFANLHTLSVGDIITVSDSNGKTCSYSVQGREHVNTVNDKIPYSVYQELFFPDVSQGSILSIQTCTKGSITQRIVIRAKIVQ
jgi:sortase (surface protein transpeptidase)